MSVLKVIPGTDPRQHHHPTAKLGFCVYDALNGDLELEIPEHGGPWVFPIPGDGNCATEAIRRGYEQVTRHAGNQAPVEYNPLSSDVKAVNKLKIRCGEMLLKFVEPNWVFEGSESLVDDSARLKLDALGLWAEELAQDAVKTIGARRVTQDGGDMTGLTWDWLRKGLLRSTKVNGRYMRIPEIAGMAVALGCNIVIWEFNGTCLVPYRNLFTSGMFLVSPDAAYIHLVHNTFTEWSKSYPDMSLTRWKTRFPGFSTSVPKHNHFEYVNLDDSPGSRSVVLGPIEVKINDRMRMFKEETDDAVQTVTRITPTPISAPLYDTTGVGDIPENGMGGAGSGDTGMTPPGLVGTGAGSGDVKSLRICQGIVGRTGARCTYRAKPGSSRCGRHPLPTGMLECTEEEDYADAPSGRADLTGPGSGPTKSTNVGTYMKGHIALEKEPDYQRCYRAVWRMGHTLGKTFTKENATGEHKEGDLLPWWEQSPGDTDEDCEPTSEGLSDCVEETDPSRRRSQVPFADRPSKKKKQMREARLGYEEDEKDEENGDDGDSANESKGSDYDDDEGRGGGGGLKDSGVGGERWGAFSIAESVAATLPCLCLDSLPLFRKDNRGALFNTFFGLTFPTEAVQLLVDKTNENAQAHQEDNDQWEAVKALAKQELGLDDDSVDQDENSGSIVLKKLTNGSSAWPDDGITLNHMNAVIGLVILMGIQNFPEMKLHWDTREMYDFRNVRECMTRDFFLLIYCRFFHMASKSKARRGDEDYDILHQIRELESILNKQWSTICDPGRWISVDEQMVKNKGRFSAGVQRHMPGKPIKHGIKLWAVCCWTGFCFMAYTDGGFDGDPRIRRWAADPLGRTCRLVLFVLFHACKEFGDKLKDSGIMMACDNYFTSPILFLCLATHGVFAVGTLRSTLRGASDAKTWLVKNCKSIAKSTGSLKERGQMVFVRMGKIAFTLWKDSKDVFFASTIHVYKRHFKGLKYSRRQARAKSYVGQQPPCRRDYTYRMAGCDKGDQYNACHAFLHRSKSYFWRRVFEQKVAQALTNGWLMYRAWLEALDYENVEISQDDLETERKAQAFVGVHPVFGGCEKAIRDRYANAVRELKAVTRTRWLEDMSQELMSQCKQGRVPPEKKPKPEGGHGGSGGASGGIRDRAGGGGSSGMGGGVGGGGCSLERISTRRRCLSPDCQPMSPTSRGVKSACTWLACRCVLCGEKGIPMCKPCYTVKGRHEETAAYLHGRRTQSGHKATSKQCFFIS